MKIIPIPPVFKPFALVIETEKELQDLFNVLAIGRTAAISDENRLAATNLLDMLKKKSK